MMANEQKMLIKKKKKKKESSMESTKIGIPSVYANTVFL